MAETEASRVLADAGARSGIDTANAETIRVGENAIYRLPSGIIARVTRPGQQSSAAKEVAVARWLKASGVPAVELIPNIDQPVQVAERSVTFWRELPSHRCGDYTRVAELVKEVHGLAIPDFLPPLDPFVRLDERIDAARTFDANDRRWMHDHLSDLKSQYNCLPPGLPNSAIHGDAHGGNVAILPDNSAVLLDLERFAVGPPEWDLMLAAFDYGSCGWIRPEEYEAFVAQYGYDVMESPRFPVLRGIREFRKMLFAAQVAAEKPELNDQAHHRLACLRGDRGDRPWTGWRPVP
jgi:hypothetical protein